MIKTAIKRQLASTRIDVFRCAQLCNFREYATSASPRRRPRRYQPSTMYADNVVRSLQIPQLLKTVQLINSKQCRALSSSISSSDNDSGETNSGAISTDIQSTEGKHQMPENGTHEVESLYSESSTTKLNIASDSEFMDYKPYEMPCYDDDDNTRYDESASNMQVSIKDNMGHDNGAANMPESFVSNDVLPVPFPINQPNVEDRTIDIANESFDLTDNKERDSFDTSQRLVDNVDSNTSISLQNQDHDVPEQETGLTKKVIPPKKHPLISRLTKCIHVEDVRTSIKTFNKIMETNKANEMRKEPSIDVPPGLTKALMYLVQPGNPIHLYQIIRYYLSIPTTYEKISGGTIDEYKKYYRLACDSVRHVDPRVHMKSDIKKLVRTLMVQVGKLDRSGQEMCVPILLSAVCEQPYSVIGEYFAATIYKYMMDQNFAVPDGYWIHILSFSKYNRHDIPYHEILTRAVSLGLRPDPIIVLNVLENYFPFSNVNIMTSIMKALLTLQKQVATDIQVAKAAAIKDETVNVDAVVAKQYFVDVHILETIGAAAAVHGQSEINLLIWDMLDVLEYKPSVGIFENTVVAFAMNTFTYREAFTVLYEMELRGYYPSRALIRSVSVHVRDSIRNIDFAQMHVAQLRQENNVKITTSIMNVLMSAAAERGDIDRLLFILKDFDLHNVAFNADTISFGFESLGKNLMRRRKFNSTFLDNSRASTRDHIDACMVVANVLLNHMDDNQVKTSDHIIRNYIEFLCLAGHVDTATSILLEAVHEKGLVSSKSLYRVAMANAKLFRFDVARQVATCDHSIPPLTFLLDSIDREEKLFNVSLQVQREQVKDTIDFDPLPNSDESTSNRRDNDNRSVRSTPVSSFWKQQTTSGNEQ